MMDEIFLLSEWALKYCLNSINIPSAMNSEKREVPLVNLSISYGDE